MVIDRLIRKLKKVGLEDNKWTKEGCDKHGDMIVFTVSKRIFPGNPVSKLLVCPISSWLSHSNVEKTVSNKVTSTNAKYYSTNNQQSEQKSAGVGQRTDSSYGSAHPISNMPNIRFAIGENETLKEKKLREFKENLASWHHQFWLNHNESFNKNKKVYLLKRANPNTRINEKEHADDLSIFYKDVLDENFRTHFKYQREWYKKNFQVLWYGFQVEMEKLLKKIKGLKRK